MHFLERRTDLAMEAREIWAENAEEQTELQGVEAADKVVDGFAVTTVRILDANGAKKLCKPIGNYVTIELEPQARREPEALERGAAALREELAAMLQLKEGDSVLVVGLGNAQITADAIGPVTAKNTLATRHLVEQTEEFRSFRPVSVLETGVLGLTGIESAEIIKAVVERVRPDRVIAVDALASRKLSRVCRTVQLADTGIVPGSGVGNGRAAINRETLGVPVVAVGVPTVVDAGTLAADLLEQAGGQAQPEDFSRFGGGMVVTPKDIDARVADISRLLGFGINLALQPGLSIGDIMMLMD